MSTPQSILFSLLNTQSVNNHHRVRKREQSSAVAFLVHSSTQDTDYVLLVRSHTARGSLRHSLLSSLPSRHLTQHDIPVIAGTQSRRTLIARPGKPSNLAFPRPAATLRIGDSSDENFPLSVGRHRQRFPNFLSRRTGAFAFQNIPPPRASRLADPERRLSGLLGAFEL